MACAITPKQEGEGNKVSIRSHFLYNENVKTAKKLTYHLIDDLSNGLDEVPYPLLVGLRIDRPSLFAFRHIARALKWVRYTFKK
jgi:hypothetical protein